MLVQYSKPILSLKKIADHCKESLHYNTSTIGVIVDITRPVFRQKDNDYIMQIRIVDQSLNGQNYYGILVTYCSVYIFVKKDKLKDLFIGNMIGQILYLQNCSFSLWNKIKLQTKYLNTNQKILGLDINNENIQIIGSLGYFQAGRKISQETQKRAMILKQWFDQFFFVAYKPFLGVQLLNEYCIMIDPFSMILRIKKQQNNMLAEQEDFNENKQKIFFQDSNENTYFIYRKDYNFPLPNSNYVYLRSIKGVIKYYQIVFSQTGYILGLPQKFNKLYEKQMNYCAVSRFNQKFLTNNKRSSKFTRIDYPISDITPIDKLLKDQSLYENKQITRDQMVFEDYYRLQCVVINFQGKLNLFHTQNQFYVHQKYLQMISTEQRKQLTGEGKIKYVFQGTLGVIDRSSECSGRLFYVHIFTSEDRTVFFQPQFLKDLNDTIVKCGRPGTRQTTQHNKLKIQKQKIILEKIKKFVEQTSFANPIALLVEPIKSDYLVYRLTNTIFI